MNNFKTWWNNTDSIEIVLFASLAFCVGWGLYHTVIGVIDRFFQKGKTMIGVLVVVSALWFADNSEFVNTAREQQAEGKTWHYVGWQDHEEDLPAITMKTDSAEKVIWKLK